MEIRPFKALRFDAAVVGDVGKCLAPPYDVIDQARQNRLYEKSEYNIVRIIKGKTTSADGPANNQYTRAAKFLNDWVANGVLKADPAEAIYAYVQDFELEGKKLQRSGFVALGKLYPFGAQVHPHENTLDAPKADRLSLMHATAAQFGPVFMLYNDPQDLADKLIKQLLTQQPLIDFVDENNVQHRLFSISSAESIGLICRMMAEKDVVIADGHHRYETALDYYNQTQNPAAEFRMMTFVNVRSEGLVILPTHRLVGNVKDFDVKKLINGLNESFEITEFGFSFAEQKQAAKQKMFEYMDAGFKQGKNAFGIYAGGSSFYTAMPAGGTAGDVMAGLDAVVLHNLILEKVLGIGRQTLAGQRNIEYIKGVGSAVEESIARVDSGEKQVVFFMNPCTIDQVRAVAAAGQKMPQKSTFFYPKFFTGLTNYKL